MVNGLGVVIFVVPPGPGVGGIDVELTPGRAVDDGINVWAVDVGIDVELTPGRAVDDGINVWAVDVGIDVELTSGRAVDDGINVWAVDVGIDVELTPGRAVDDGINVWAVDVGINVELTPGRAVDEGNNVWAVDDEIVVELSSGLVVNGLVGDSVGPSVVVFTVTGPSVNFKVDVAGATVVCSNKKSFIIIKYSKESKDIKVIVYDIRGKLVGGKL